MPGAGEGVDAMSKHKIRASCPFANSDDGIEVEIAFTYRKGSPDYWNKAGGHWEQGYAAEVELEAVCPVDPALILPSDLQKALNEWADLYLADDEGYGAACDAASDD